jgi:putative chitinase
MISAEKLHALGIGSEWSEPLTTTFTTFGINDVNKQAAFIGQCSHECNHFKTLEENLSYSSKGIQDHFHTHFKPDEYDLFAHKPEKIANRIYANRSGNRNEASGDGWRFHGRGCIQLTFHDNYWHFGKAVGQDFVAHPELVATPMFACMSAGWFWATHGCSPLAEAQNWLGLTKRINGGTIGLDERISLTKRALDVLGA